MQMQVQKKMNPLGDILWAIGIFLVLMIILSSLGCVSKGFKHLQGSEMVIGLSSPVSSASVDVSAMQMISGQKLEVESGNRVRMVAKTETEGSYFGVITTKSTYSVEAETVPTNIVDNVSK